MELIKLIDELIKLDKNISLKEVYKITITNFHKNHNDSNLVEMGKNIDSFNITITIKKNTDNGTD
jgi:hypothetical protein